MKARRWVEKEPGTVQRRSRATYAAAWCSLHEEKKEKRKGANAAEILVGGWGGVAWVFHFFSPILRFLSKIRCFRTFLRTPLFFVISKFWGKNIRFRDLWAAMIFSFSFGKSSRFRSHDLSLHALGGIQSCTPPKRTHPHSPTNPLTQPYNLLQRVSRLMFL